MEVKSSITRLILPKPQNHGHGDIFTLRAHRVLALTVLSLAVTTGVYQYFGNPINCWSQEFSAAAEAFTESHCYFNRTYYSQKIDVEDTTPVAPSVNYYKLTPFILAFFAILYLGPEIIVSFGYTTFLYNFYGLLERARQSNEGSPESRQLAVEELVVELQNRVANRVTRETGTGIWRWIGHIKPSIPSYIKLQHFSTKLVFAFGAFFPMIVLRNYLYLNFDLGELMMTTNSNISDESLFPKTIFCSFEVHHIWSSQMFHVHCTMPACDMFEKVALLVGFLAIIVCTINISDVTSFVIRLLFSPWDYPYIKKHMDRITDVNSQYSKGLLRGFVERYLKSDVIYFLQLIGQNSSENVVCQILAKLWEGYVGNLVDNTTPTVSSHDEQRLLELDNFADGNNV